MRSRRTCEPQSSSIVHKISHEDYVNFLIVDLQSQSTEGLVRIQSSPETDVNLSRINSQVNPIVLSPNSIYSLFLACVFVGNWDWKKIERSRLVCKYEFLGNESTRNVG